MSKIGHFDTKKLVKKIEQLTRLKMKESMIVPLNDFRKLKHKKTIPTLLVIEDDDSMRRAFRKIFEKEGYKVKIVSDGTQLSSVLNDDPIDLIILDVGLPWLNGFELAQLLKDHEDLKKIPLIFVSGKNSQDDIDQGLKLGADDYITKPFDIEYLKKRINFLLDDFNKDGA